MVEGEIELFWFLLEKQGAVSMWLYDINTFDNLGWMYKNREKWEKL